MWEGTARTDGRATPWTWAKVFAWSATALVAACGGACGSAGNDLPSDTNWQSIHFSYHSRTGDKAICEDVLVSLEQHFATLQGYFGFAWPAGKQINYYRFADSADFQSHSDCPPDAGGCARQSDVESPEGLDTHELAHAYLFQTGFPPWVLVEGVAVALSCTSRFYGDSRPALTWDQLANISSGARDPVTAYHAGAWLVGYLLDVFGPQRFLTLYAALPHDAGPAEMNSTFQQVLGQDLATVWAAAISEDAPRNNCVWQCSRPPLALDGAAVDTSGTCGTVVDRPFHLPAEATIAFAISGAAISLGPCGSAPAPKSGLNGGLPGGLLALYHLRGGSYFVEHNATSGTIVSLADASASLADTCAAASDVAALDRTNLYVALPASPTTSWYLPLKAPPPGGRRLVVLADGGATASVCASCAAGSSCNDWSRAEPWTEGQVLVLTPDLTRAFSEFLLSWP